jgi:hypothetical protein
MKFFLRLQDQVIRIGPRGAIFQAAGTGDALDQDLRLFPLREGLDLSYGFVFFVINIETFHQTVTAKIAFSSIPHVFPS